MGHYDGLLRGRPRRLISTDGGVSRAASPPLSIGKTLPMFNRFKAALLSALFALFALALIAPSHALVTDPNKIIPARTCESGQQVCYVRVTVNFNDPRLSSGVWFATIPKNAYILSIDADTTTAWNAATTNVLTFGATAASANEIIADGASATANISNDTTTIATGIRHLTTALGLATAITGNSTYQTAINGDVPIYVKYTQTGTAATTGSTTVIFTFAKNDDN